MDAFIAFRDDAADAEELRAFCGPIARRAGTVFFSGENYERNLLGDVLGGGVEDRHFLARRQIPRVAAFDMWNEFVPQADVGECAADHDFVVAAAGTLGIEVAGLHAVGDEILSGGAVFLDRSGGGNVVSSNAVAEDGQDAGAADFFYRGRLHRHTVEVRGLADISGIRAPGVGLAFGNAERAPARIAGVNFTVAFLEHRGIDTRFDRLFHFLLCRPDIGEVDGLAVLASTERVFVEVEVDASRDGESHDERGRHQVVRTDFGVHAAFEIAIAGENGRDDQIFLFDGV